MQDDCAVIGMHKEFDRKNIHQDVSGIERSGLTLGEVGKSLESDRIPKREIACLEAYRVVKLHGNMLLEDINPAENSSAQNNLKVDYERQKENPLEEKSMSRMGLHSILTGQACRHAN